jgi:hypothetical protein
MKIQIYMSFYYQTFSVILSKYRGLSHKNYLSGKWSLIGRVNNSFAAFLSFSQTSMPPWYQHSPYQKYKQSKLVLF